MSRRKAAQGQPLVALSVILMSWVGARALIIEATPSAAEQANLAAATVSVAPVAPEARRPLPKQAGVPTDAAAGTTLPDPVAPSVETRVAPRSIEPVPPSFTPVPHVLPTIAPAAPLPAVDPAPAPLPVKVAAGHQLLWMAALSHMPLPAELAPPQSVRALPRPPSLAPHVASRWSGDAWVLYRRDSVSLAQGGFFPATYGASQAGAVLRFRLDPTSGHRPSLYLRASSALQDPRSEEAALGFSFRPVADLPVAALFEARLTRVGTGTSLRPAAILVTELPAFDLPAGVRGEVYVQAGYVGGQDETAFVDGQFKADRRVVSVGGAELRLGGGVWGGAQDGAARVDAGPSATLGLPLGDSANARVAMDWRFRIAGDAAPRSGPAITLSVGF